MMDLFVSLLAGVALLATVAARWAGSHARRSIRLLDRLEVKPAAEPHRGPGAPLLDGWATRIAGTSWGGRLRARAESHHPGVPFSDVLAIAGAAVLGGWLFGMLLFGSAPAATVAAAVSPYAVDRFFLTLHGNRATRIEKQLPEALSLQAGLLRAGQSLGRSLRILAEETKPPLSEELQRMLREVDLGRPIDQALERLAARIPSKDLDMWVTAMLVHRQTGGNLAGVMDSSARRVTSRLQLRSEVRAMTAQGRLSGLVVAGAPLAFFLLMSLGSREQVDFLFKSPLGLVVLASGLTLNGLGLLWIRHALRVRS